MGLLTVKKTKTTKKPTPKHDSLLVYGGRSPQEFLNTELGRSVRIFGYADRNTTRHITLKSPYCLPLHNECGSAASCTQSPKTRSKGNLLREEFCPRDVQASGHTDSRERKAAQEAEQTPELTLRCSKRSLGRPSLFTSSRDWTLQVPSAPRCGLRSTGHL